MRHSVVLVMLLWATACVQRVAAIPPDLKSQLGPLPPQGSVDLIVVPDSPGARWQVTGRTEQCVAPCAMRVLETDRLVLTGPRGDVLEFYGLPPEVASARRGILVAEDRNRALQVNGIVFTTLGGMTSVVALTLSAVGCSDVTRRGGLCTAGLVTAAVGMPLLVSSIWMIVASAPQAHLLPVSSEPGTTPVSLGLTPTGVWGTF